MAGRRLLFVGLDALGAGLIFERLREVMPALGALRARGCHGPLRSCAPPVTVPAWTCMLSGRDPGELGLYGFRLRDRGGYALRTVRGTDVRAKRVFDHLGEQGAHVVVLFVPPSSPPPPVRGVSAACLLHTEGAWTAPASLGPLLEARFGPYVPDVVEGRQRPDEETLLRLLAATRQRFAIARELWRSERPDALFVVDTAPDRVLHAWLRHLDPSHPRHDPAAPIAERVVGYFAALDEQLEALLALAGSDCTVIVASDHGVRPRLGAVRVNEWLLRQGWLVLRIDRPAQPVALRPQDVDWSRTRAWAEGGYHARLWLNVRGREREGIVAGRAFDGVLEALEVSLRELGQQPGVGGAQVVRPERLYRRTLGVPPDLMVFFGGLSMRADGRVGGSQTLVVDADGRGHDDANHDWDGMFVMAGPALRSRGPIEGLRLFDVGPTCLAHAGLRPPEDWLGRVVP